MDKDEKAPHGEDVPESTAPEDQNQASLKADPAIDSPADNVPGDEADVMSVIADPPAEQQDEPQSATVSAGDPQALRDRGDDAEQAAVAPEDQATTLPADDENPGAPTDDAVPETMIGAPDRQPRDPAIILVPSRQTRPLARLTWHYSAILPVALLALLATLFFAPAADEPETIAFRVLEDGTGEPLAGVQVSVGDKVMTSDAEGIVRIDKTGEAMTFRVVGDGFPAASGRIDPNGGARQQISLPRLASASAGLGAMSPDGSATGGASSQGNQANSQADIQPPPGTPRAGNVRTPGTGPIEGTVLSATGDPLRGARVTDGKMLEITGKDGLFSLDRAKLAGDASLTISAPGYADRVINAAEVSAPVEIQLEERPVNALYMNPNISTTDADVDRLIEIIDTTEANAIVIDIKEELIFYDSQVEFFQDAGTVRPIIDLPTLLKKFQDHDIYTIARLVVFKDSLVAENRPDLAVLNSETGDLWRDMNGVSWVNPMVHELWEANSDLAVEAAELGFDEIQYDYVRFPTDGDLSTTDYGLENTQENRENSIHKLLKMTREKLLPTGAKLSADVFGYTLLVDDDLGIGQNFVKLAEYLDYLSPMVYPSHFPNGSIAVDGHPNDFPYETIEISMRAGKNKLGGDASQIRPWLQDFSFFDLMPYGDEEVRAQIKAAEDVGTSGWMLWDPNNEYHPGGLDPEEPPDKPAAVLPGSGRSSVTTKRLGIRTLAACRMDAAL